MTREQLFSELKIGWNLGDTLDSFGEIEQDELLDRTHSATHDTSRALTKSPEECETCWMAPVTTKEMIDTVRKAGFNILRVPTTWFENMGPAPEYTINEEFLKRVQEVIDYGYQEGMFVILNLHHENWHFPTQENFSKAAEILEKVWVQLATYFKDYDQHLIFEGMNEPRLVGTPLEWNGGDDASREVVNQLGEVFVQAVRKTGGNNSQRFLMVSGYAASSNPRALEAIRVPKDDHVIVSVHAYEPWEFALAEAEEGKVHWNEEEDTEKIDSLMNNIQRLFLDKNIPVIIGEFGARNRNNEKDRAKWGAYYIKKAKETGVPCIWWDNFRLQGKGELFGLLNRTTLTWEFPELVEALTSPY